MFFKKWNEVIVLKVIEFHHHHHKHPGLGHLACSVSRVTVALSIVYSVSRLFSFLVGCSEMILKGFGFVAFFAGVKAISFCNNRILRLQSPHLIAAIGTTLANCVKPVQQ
jgi:hypothetical protein